MPKLDSKGSINRFTFMFIIGLHIDDYEALKFIQNKLNIGIIRKTFNECKFIVTKKEDIYKIITIFEIFNLNTSKYLDYINFKEAYNLYYKREELLTEELKNQIIKLKKEMNKGRVDFTMPFNHNIVINKN